MAKEIPNTKRIKSNFHNSPYISMNSSTGETLNFTSENFTRGSIWDNFPECLYIDQLEPVEPWEVSLKKLFDAIDEKRLKFTCSCPQERIRKFLASRYIMCYDTAGSRFYANFIPKKNISLLAIPEDQSKLLIKEKLSPSDTRPESPKVLFRTHTLK